MRIISSVYPTIAYLYPMSNTSMRRLVAPPIPVYQESHSHQSGRILRPLIASQDDAVLFRHQEPGIPNSMMLCASTKTACHTSPHRLSFPRHDPCRCRIPCPPPTKSRQN
ncbi:hypothetical protein P152DRAFT_194334 [Eremomyces bilateralis CBS 781.70]|uniref:Uncharacterized protein n=1 Tax=Eremomyces bilateralis CBS 781.70 TaxID=1392243 RepID=A0A6G1GCT6_9PEZI|nr:uncharacterized protein P152DRAFT_194334 [Eremomyces bilateralis CBS 781.70]KAF1815716.1 hypothetical protein P152DRAFT_194334 [Eremomyces bilateralis CBS 781.70]